MATGSGKTIPEMEQEVLEFWKNNKVFEKSVERNPDNNRYVFYDGPPFISGLPHYGHLLGSIAKDLIPRYWTMKGKRIERVWGWDAHGLTVENKVQKKLGIKDRREIEAYGLEKFTQECYKYTSEVSAEWGWYIDRIGRWVDMEHAYKTTDQTYMESVMWAFKQLYDKGLIYEGVRTSLFCTTCGTPVSNFEVAMDNSYKDVEDPAITVKFPITTEGKFKDVSILAWTTTPWTIPSNRALVLDKNAEYSVVSTGGEKYIAATARLSDVFSGVEYQVVETVQGEELLGLEYDPPFRFFVSKEGEFKVYHFEGMANMEEGTGIVHSAPGFGEVDTAMGMHYGLTIMLVINDEGKFLPGTAGENPYAGMYYAKANDFIREDLKNKGVLFKDEKIVHRFPYHDRCNTLIIQKAQNSWFVNVQSLKDELIKNNLNVHWVPEHLKEGRFRQGIEQAPDWGISRSRFWATPMPVWQSDDGDLIVVTSVKELEELSGQTVKDLHRPYIDEIVINKDGKEFRRIPDVLDSWFEAGSMPYAQLHYPFENQEKFEQNYPGDFIVEYISQTRAWFYVMHVLSTALFSSNSFKNVISTGVMAGNDGRKMSKTYGNYADPKAILLSIGGDALRLYLMGSPLMVGDNANFDEVELRNKSRNVLNPLLNSAKFFTMYADLHQWNSSKSVESQDILDKWIVARLHQVIKGISENIERYYVPPAVKEVELFVDDLSRWYVRRSRDRISSGNMEALSTLFYVLDTFSKAAAPIIPFMTEMIHRDLSRYSSNNLAESVHLEDFPDYLPSKLDESLIDEMSKTREIVSLGHALRTESKISVRQPLSQIKVFGVAGIGEEYISLIRDELNVKEVVFTNEEGSLRAEMDFNITKELRQEGLAREMVRTIQDLRKSSGLQVTERISASYPDTDENREVVENFGEDIRNKVLADELVPGADYAIAKRS